MSVTANELDRAIDALRDELGADRVLDGPQATHEIQGRTLNPSSELALRYLLRPHDTEECRIVVQTLASIGHYPTPIGALTTFWEPHSDKLDVALDTLAMRTPCDIDVRERVGYFGAGIAVREVDLLAREHGLCLLAYPDSDGSASVGSMAAVACTTGLGLGRIQPVEQVVGMTVVARDATVVKTGTAWRLGRGGVAHGFPDPGGIFLGSQGRFGIITEVILTLATAPFLAARTWSLPWQPPDELARELRQLRQSLDRGTIDSFRLETVCAGREQPNATEWFVRCWAAESAETAAGRCAAVVQTLGGRESRGWIESDAGRRGELPDYDERYSLPPGSHHSRTGRSGFLGIEVNVNWGDQLDQTLRVFTDLFVALGSLGIGHRRLGIYPSNHFISIGVQAMLSGGDAKPDDVRRMLAAVVESLTALGVVPYRPGRLWKGALDRQEAGDPASLVVRRAGLSGDRR